MQEHPLMMRCDSCGEMNRLPVVHCKKCGAKLNFEAAEERLLQGDRPSAVARLRSWVRRGLFLAVLAVVLLAMLPGSMQRTTGSDLDARRYRMKTELLIDALDRGMPASQSFSEAEINAFLHDLLAAQPSRSGWNAVLEDLGVRLVDGYAEVFMAVGRGPFSLTMRMGVVVKEKQAVVNNVQVGRLPLPGALAPLYARTQARLLRQLKNESRILRNLNGMLIQDGTLDVLVRLGG